MQMLAILIQVPNPLCLIFPSSSLLPLSLTKHIRITHPIGTPHLPIKVILPFTQPLYNQLPPPNPSQMLGETLPVRHSLSSNFSFSAWVANCISRSSRFFLPVTSASSVSIRSWTCTARFVVRAGWGVLGGDKEDGDDGGLSFGGVRMGWSLSESKPQSQHRIIRDVTEIHCGKAPDASKEWW